ncbi:hypothetical protein [Sinorhizobium meliloti]|nr:hypothetical protein [Sinorhizobium meliloti]MQX19785.1 hypothetical protein [Sinorhizobium meliloti]UFX07400.1 hypothetical protein SmelRRI128_13100 [Sinorhizobium meliloti]
MNNPNPAPDEAPEDEAPIDKPAELDHHGEVPHDDDSLFDDGTGYVP